MPAGQTGGTCLFIPGIPGGPAVWGPLPDLAPKAIRVLHWPLENWQVINPDSTAELDRLEAAVRADIAALPGPVTLVGHSFGAWLIARTLEHLDPATTHAVLFSGMPSITAEHRETLQTLRADITTGKVRETQFDINVLELMLGADQKTPANELCISRLVADMSLPRISALLGLVSQLAGPAYQIRPYDIPTDVVHAIDDRAAPLAYSQELARLGTHARLHAWPGDTHLPHWSDPEAAADLIFSAG